MDTFEEFEPEVDEADLLECTDLDNIVTKIKNKAR